MFGTLKTFDPKKGLLTIGGIPIEGYADGTYINLTWPEDLWNAKSGADGERDRIKNATGFLANLEVTLMQGATINAALWALMELDYNTNSPFPILFKDLQGVTVWESSKCFFTKPSPYTLEKASPSNRVWAFELPKVIGVIGGN